MTDPLEPPDREARVARALEFIEANLGRPFAMEAAAEEAAWSLWHFNRVFSEELGLGPGTYLRLRRLSEAARDLARSGGPLRDIAAARGFGSPEAFTRSFAAHFGAAPSLYRGRVGGSASMGPFLPVRRPVLGLRGASAAGAGSSLEGVEITRLGELRLAGRSRLVGLRREELSAESELLWRETLPSIAGFLARGEGSLHLVAFFSPEAPGRAILSFVGVELRPGRELPPGLEPRVLPAGEYCRALHRGPADLLPESWLELYALVLPRLGRRPRGDFDLDRPKGPDPGRADYRTELLLPLLPD